jgi:TetR/AcrR family tetracycline transcriptional repressor
MSGAMFGEAVPQPDIDSPDFDWLAWVAEGARGIRRVALSRRDGAIVMAKSRPSGPSRIPPTEVMTRAMQRSGLAEQDAQMVLLALGRFALGWVLYEQTAAPRPTLAGGDEGFEYGLQLFLTGLAERVKTTAA